MESETPPPVNDENARARLYAPIGHIIVNSKGGLEIVLYDNTTLRALLLHYSYLLLANQPKMTGRMYIDSLGDPQPLTARSAEDPEGFKVLQDLMQEVFGPEILMYPTVHLPKRPTEE